MNTYIFWNTSNYDLEYMIYAMNEKDARLLIGLWYTHLGSWILQEEIKAQE